MTPELKQAIEDLTGDCLLAGGLSAATVLKSDLKLVLAALDAYRVDAELYRWIEAQPGLSIESCGSDWVRPADGSEYTASHRVRAGGTLYAPRETLRETIEAARKTA